MRGSAVVAALALVATACAGGTETARTASPPATTTTSTTPAQTDTIAVIADYSPTVSDVGGLMFLLLHPRVDVIAITLPAAGEAGCDLGVDVTLRILTLLDRTEIPVACDPDLPEDAKAWPAEFLRQSRNLLYLLPEPEVAAADVAAPELISKVLAASDRPVVVWAVAPLTNIARALEDDPASAEAIERIVIMGGAVDVPGNVFESPAEWNIYIDSGSAAAVFASSVPITLVPLDATNDLPVPLWWTIALKRSQQSESIAYLGRLAGLFPLQSGFWYFWDELAAVAIAEPEIATTNTARMSVTVGGADDGRTARDPRGAEVTLTTGVPDPNAFYAEFLRVLSGGPAPVGRQLTADEIAYADALDDAFAPLLIAASALFAAEDLDETWDPERAAILLGDLADAARGAVDEVATISAPDAFAQAQADFLSEIEEVVPSLEEAVQRVHEVDSLDALFAVVSTPTSEGACTALLIELQLAGLDVGLPC